MEFQQNLYQEYDREAVAILNDFLPQRIFDSHVHFFDRSFTPKISKLYGAERGSGADCKTFFSTIFQDRTVSMNLFAFPDQAMSEPTGELLKKSDDFLVRELEQDKSNTGELIVMPDETAEQLEKRLVHPRIKGLKCYHIFSNRENTFDCDIGEYLPESAWELANRKKLSITLHMVKEKALADEGNLNYICQMAKKYQDATLILAHAARSFACWTAVERVEKVKHLENVWFDFSGVCESPAMLQILKKVGASRCMWGSDFPVCISRGKAISIADTFYWIGQKDLDRFDSKTPVRNWLIGIENLMATRQACILADLSKTQIEDLFYGNAKQLFGQF